MSYLINFNYIYFSILIMLASWRNPGSDVMQCHGTRKHIYIITSCTIVLRLCRSSNLSELQSAATSC